MTPRQPSRSWGRFAAGRRIEESRWGEISRDFWRMASSFISSHRSLQRLHFSSKCSKNRLVAELRPDPLGSLYALSCSPSPQCVWPLRGQKSENRQFILIPHLFQKQIQPRPKYLRYNLCQFCILKCTYKNYKFQHFPMGSTPDPLREGDTPSRAHSHKAFGRTRGRFATDHPSAKNVAPPTVNCFRRHCRRLRDKFMLALCRSISSLNRTSRPL